MTNGPCPSWPCRHIPRCYDEYRHWSLSGFEYPDDMLNDPVCDECGWPGASCSCSDIHDDSASGEVHLTQDEFVVKQKPGHRIVQVSDEDEAVLRALADKCTCMCPYASAAKVVARKILDSEPDKA